MMEQGESPKIVTSKRRIVYKKSSWCFHDFEIWTGELLCRIFAVKMKNSVLIWIGDANRTELGEIAIGMPALVDGTSALSSSLLGPDVVAAPLARQLASALKQPVYICCGANFDKLTLPFVIKGLITEIKSRPEIFGNKILL